MKKSCALILILALLLTGFPGARAQSVSGQIRVAEFSLPVYGGGSAGPAHDPVALVIDKNGYIRACFDGMETVTNEFLQAALGIPDVVSMSLGFSEKLLRVGKTLKLKPVVVPSSAKKYVRYSSSDPAVVRVSSSGKLKAVGKGVAVITAEVGGKSASCTITTDIPLKTMTLSAGELSLSVGAKKTLKVASYSPVNTTSKKKKQWSSSAPNVASVSASGVVKAKAPGEAVIRCTVDGIEARCAVRVDSKAVAYAAEVLRLVNVEREKAGLAPLLSHASLDASANIRAQEIKTLFSHTRPDGSGCDTVFTIAVRNWGENIAMGQKSAGAVMKAWMNSPGHRANILTAGYTHLGVGVYESKGRLYWVQMFAGLR